jgi:MFS family permease
LTYLGEFRSHWRPLLGASTGLATGAALNYFTLSVFAPALIADLGWSKADFALVGSLPLLTMFLMPVAGRFTDRFGPRIAVMVGFIAVPLGFLGISTMSGTLFEFLAINTALNVLGVLTTSLVFCRVVIERFDKARGIALSIMMSASPLAGAIAPPLLGGIITQHGWRAGYVSLAFVSGIGGLIAIMLMGNGRHSAPATQANRQFSRQEFIGLLRDPVFLLLVGGMFLVNVPQVFASSQLKLVVMGHGVSDHMGTWMVSLYAIGVIVGRCLCGLALDRVRAHLVAVVALGVPTVGYLLFASHVTATSLLIMAVLIIGLAQGAESDVGAYLISRRFGLRNFSLLFSFINMTVAGGMAAGSLVLSMTLRGWDSYLPFMLLCAATTLCGAMLLGLTGTFVADRQPAATIPAAAPATESARNHRNAQP